MVGSVRILPTVQRLPILVRSLCLVLFLLLTWLSVFETCSSCSNLPGLISQTPICRFECYRGLPMYTRLSFTCPASPLTASWSPRRSATLGSVLTRIDGPANRSPSPSWASPPESGSIGRPRSTADRKRANAANRADMHTCMVVLLLICRYHDMYLSIQLVTVAGC